MTSLAPGANTAIDQSQLTVAVIYSPVVGVDLDMSAFLLGADGKVRGDTDMCFYGQTSVSNGAVQLTASKVGYVVFSLNLDRLDQAIEKVALTATFHENKANFAACSNLELSISSGVTAPISTQGMKETALILGEFYRRQGRWKFRNVAQGFDGGLLPLATHFGVDISVKASLTPAPVVTPTPVLPPTTKVSLTKISLDKSRPSISLEKKSMGDFGEIKVNLNWNRGRAPNSASGFFSKLLGNNNGMDLDVACLYELQNGQVGQVQALGNRFGDYASAPHIQLMGDDRTGSSSEGEWLRINGKQWNKIRRVLVYAFIYEGAPSWAATDGIVTLYVPDQPPIEVRMNEQGGAQTCCAIALLENVGDGVKVTREVKYFANQKPMDEAYRFGLRWNTASK